MWSQRVELVDWRGLFVCVRAWEGVGGGKGSCAGGRAHAHVCLHLRACVIVRARAAVQAIESLTQLKFITIFKARGWDRDLRPQQSKNQMHAAENGAITPKRVLRC